MTANGTLFRDSPCLAGALRGRAVMRNLRAVGGLAAAAFLLAPMSGANAFLPGQTEIVGAAAAVNDIVQVKRHKSVRPRGWSRGRKVGWRGGRVPPGQRR